MMETLSERWIGLLWGLLLLMVGVGATLLWRLSSDEAPIYQVEVKQNNELKFARGEYFIRFRDDHLHRIDEVLADHDVELVFPITPHWALVVEKRFRHQREFLSFAHESVPEYMAKAKKLLADDAIVSASFNHDIRSLAEDLSPMNKTANTVSLKREVSDPFFSQQWNLQEAKPWQMGAANIDRAWEITKGSSRVVLAPIEQGFMLTHPDIQGSSLCASRFLPGYDFRSFSRLLTFGEHGTNVLGVLAACSNNKIGIAGIDWYAKILPVVRGTTTAETLLSILWASGYDNCSLPHFKCRAHNRIPINAFPADVINLSFHVFPKSVMTKYQNYIARDYWLEAISLANRRNSILVAAAGNESEPLRHNIDMPAGAEGVIAVGSIDRNGYSPKNSRFGPGVATLAAGDRVLTTATGSHKYATVKGTSFAAPTVSGVVSLMKSVYANLSWKSAEWFIQKGSGYLTCDQYCGNKSSSKECEKLCCSDYGTNFCPGPIDAFKAVALAKSCTDPDDHTVCSTVGTGRYPKATLLDVDEYVLFADKVPFSKTIHLINHGAISSPIEIVSSHPGIRVRYPFDWMISKPTLPQAGRLAITVEVPAAFTPIPTEVTITFKAMKGGDDIVTVVKIGESV